MNNPQPESRLPDLIELKKLKLLELQKKVRFEIHAEKRLEDGTRMDVLLDWRGARRKPEISVLDVPDLEKQRKSAADAYAISSLSRNRAAALSGPHATFLAQELRRRYEHLRVMYLSIVVLKHTQICMNREEEKIRLEEEKMSHQLHHSRIRAIMERRKFLVKVHNWQKELRNNSGNDYKKRKMRNDHVQVR